MLPGQIPDRYKEEVFTNIVETNNVVFSSNVPQPKVNIFNFYYLATGARISVREYDTENVTLAMDIFEPASDLQGKRPLVIICFGGGFVQGSRDIWSIRLLAQGLARRGYVTATIDYRLGMHIYDKEIGARAVYRAVQDSRSAVRFFRANAATYKIDPDKIFIGGHSAGAFVALHNLYLDKESERPTSTLDTLQDGNPIPDLGCLDCVGDHLTFNGKANGVFSLAGAVGDLAFLENSSEAPPILFHDTEDGTVPYGVGEPFSDISIFIIGSDLPIVYGSQLISQRCDALGIENQFNTSTGLGHNVHEQGMMALQPDVLPLISAWFYEKYLKSASPEMGGLSTFCSIDLQQAYQLPPGDFVYYDWEISGGSFMSMSTAEPNVIVNWDDLASAHQLSVTPYLCNGAAADKIILDANQISTATSTWQGNAGGNWNDNANWNLGRVPLPCEEVVFPSQPGLIEIQADVDTNISIEKLTMGQNVKLTLPNGTTLSITE